VPGVQNVIGSHNHTIFRRELLENCTEMHTNGEWCEKVTPEKSAHLLGLAIPAMEKFL
jgi:hypothetical protein